MAGTSIVNIALILYTLFIYQEYKYRKITKKLLSFLTIAVLLDVTATVCMIIGSSKGPFTIHGMLGYSALCAMAIDAILIWRLKGSSGMNGEISKPLHTYSLLAYTWWVLAYITGAILVMFR